MKKEIIIFLISFFVGCTGFEPVTPTLSMEEAQNLLY